jgi:hypothetical protein
MARKIDVDPRIVRMMGRLCQERAVFAEALGRDAVGRQTVGDQLIADGLGAAMASHTIVTMASTRCCVDCDE